MPERGNTGFHKIQEIVARMKETDPEHANGWGEVGVFVDFSARQNRISRSAKDSVNEHLKPQEESYFRFKYFDFDVYEHAVIIEGEKVHLTKMNLDLLKYLIEKRKKVVSTHELIERVWENYGSSRTVAVHVHRLRKTLKSGRDIPELIETVREVGYKLVAEEIKKEETAN